MRGNPPCLFLGLSSRPEGPKAVKSFRIQVFAHPAQDLLRIHRRPFSDPRTFRAGLRPGGFTSHIPEPERIAAALPRFHRVNRTAVFLKKHAIPVFPLPNPHLIPFPDGPFREGLVCGFPPIQNDPRQFLPAHPHPPRLTRAARPALRARKPHPPKIFRN